ncbi:MAG: hypothetical protein JRG96_09795 [Deltaproteobacteria bacterium]|nr:hypothetical protein [Deltaproteobacteria bacterium]MBW2419027.1 hypothetical protein [Deltaproteobacteria bacterium]
MSMRHLRIPALLAACLLAAIPAACGGEDTQADRYAAGGEDTRADRYAAGGEDTQADRGSGETGSDLASRKPVSFTGDPGLILGTWVDESENAELGMRFESETTYTAPDRFVVRGRVVSLATGGEHALELGGTWAIKGGLLTTRLETSSHPLFPVGSNSSKRIDVLNEKELVCTEGGLELRLQRKSL